jgi:hypothetical protein
MLLCGVEVGGGSSIKKRVYEGKRGEERWDGGKEGGLS